MSANGRIVVEDGDLTEFRELSKELARTERVYSRMSLEATRALTPHLGAYVEARTAIEERLATLAKKYEVPDGQSWELLLSENGFVRRVEQEPPAAPRAERRRADREKLKAAP